MFDRIERLLDWLQFFHIQDKSALKPQGRQGEQTNEQAKRGNFSTDKMVFPFFW